MEEIAQLSAEDRRAVFSQTAANLGLAPIIAEKDFWVCWTLGRIFGLEDRPRLLFKGGTSLSKCFGLIRRFSEDIDLSLHREDIGLGGEDDPSTKSSRKSFQKAMKSFTPKVQAYVEEVVYPMLREGLRSLGEPIELKLQHTGTETEIRFQYPQSFTVAEYGGAGAYVKPIVLLELGARSDHHPTRSVRVKPYVADEIPEFARVGCEVVAQAPERTLLEKALILHSQFARANLKRTASRHAHDVAMLAADDKTMKRVTRSLLEEVAHHKFVFADDKFAKDATVSGIRIVPEGELLGELAADYRLMDEMFFEEPPPLEDVLETLRTLEVQLNDLVGQV